jgi:hypothetical protein
MCTSAGCVGAAAFSVSPSQKDFGIVARGEATAAVVFAVTNIGNADSVAPLTASFGDSKDWYWGAVSNECPTTLAVGQTCNIGVVFAPQLTTTQTQLDTFLVVSAPGATSGFTHVLGSQVVPDPGLVISPTTYDFGSAPPGFSTLSHDFVVTSTATNGSGPLLVSLTGNDLLQFSTIAGHCAGVTLTKGGSCIITMSFTPTSWGAPGQDYVSLEVVNAATNEGVTASLTGTAQ